MKRLTIIWLAAVVFAGCGTTRSNGEIPSGMPADIVARFMIHSRHNSRESAAGCLVTMGGAGGTEPDGYCDYGNSSEKKLTDSIVDFFRMTLDQNESYRIAKTVDIPGDNLKYYDVFVEFINDGRVAEVYRFNVVFYDGRYGITGYSRSR